MSETWHEEAPGVGGHRGLGEAELGVAGHGNRVSLGERAIALSSTRTTTQIGRARTLHLPKRELATRSETQGSNPEV